MARKLVTSLVLAGLLGVHAAPLVAAARPHCAMQRPVASRVCARCDVAPGPARASSFSAGSCCRFEAATPASRIPGDLPTTQRAPEGSSSPAAVEVASRPAPEILTGGGYPSDLPQPRSTDSPISLHSTLRL
jgi:hypothetical protein